jgi:hypothetical protein
MNLGTARLSLRRIGYALIAAALVGGILSSAALTGVVWLNPDAARMQWWQLVGVTLFYAQFTTPVFAIGLCVFGAPGWYLLHRYNFRGWMSPTILGAALTSVANFLLDSPPVIATAVDLHGRVAWALVMGIVGGLTGFVMWRIAYRSSHWDATAL